MKILLKSLLEKHEENKCDKLLKNLQLDKSNFVNIDMFEFAYTKPDDEKPILLTGHIRGCIALCARDPENGLTGLFHITIGFFSNKEILKKFFERFKENQSEQNAQKNLDIHLYGGYVNDDFITKKEVLEIIKKNEESKIEFTKDEKQKLASFGSNEKISNLINLLNDISDELKLDLNVISCKFNKNIKMQDKNTTKNFAIHSETGEIYNFFNEAEIKEFKKLNEFNAENINRKIGRTDNKFIKCIYDPEKNIQRNPNNDFYYDNFNAHVAHGVHVI
jgi:hypothetical protein